MKQQLEQLARLQEIDDQLSMLERSKGDYPQRIEELENSLNQRLQDVEEVERSQGELEKEKRQFERHISDYEGKLEKLQTRLADVKTNKEWDALQKEMDSVKEGLSGEEEQLLEIMEELDAMGATAESEDTELKD